MRMNSAGRGCYPEFPRYTQRGCNAHDLSVVLWVGVRRSAQL